MDSMERRTSGNLPVGIILIGLGGLFLVMQIFDINFWSFAWPFFIILPGLMFFLVLYATDKKEFAFLAIPGSIITSVGLILLFQSITGHWKSWAYAWLLIFPTSVGLGMYIAGDRGEEKALRALGLRLLRIGMMIFAIAAVLFEIVFLFGDSMFRNIVFPAVLILIGVYIVLQRGGFIGVSDNVEGKSEVEQ